MVSVRATGWKERVMGIAELVEAVKAHALAHYNDGGWDVVVECMDDAEIERWLLEDGAATVEEALAVFAGPVGVWADREADAINSAF
jgi:hypothetical protein